MSKVDPGIYQKEDGYWAFRYVVKIDGKTISSRKSVDLNGNKLKTKAAAIKARAEAINKTKLERTMRKKISRRTVAEVYKEYCDNGRKNKADTTIRKQDSLWRIHICSRFGDRFIDEISPAEIGDYLSELYYEKNYSYRFVESFLKMFYLLFGQAYTRNYLDIDSYSKLCINKGTKISMPQSKIDEDLDIKIFTKEQLDILDNYFKGTNAEMAYMLGRYCGLRINEAYGLKWDHVNLDEGKIFIDRQMAYTRGIVKLATPKTKAANRTIVLNSKVKDFMIESHKKRIKADTETPDIVLQNQTAIYDLDKSIIYSTSLANCTPNGKLQTVNSMKFHTRKIKDLYNIDFKFHYLRHTFGTMMAELHTPEHLLLNQMGHTKIETTKKYYIAVSDNGLQILRENLDKL